MKFINVIPVFMLLLLFISCSKPDFYILSGSENETLEPLLHKFAKSNGVNIHVTYKGSVDIMLELQSGSTTYDAVWPASSMWISMGDRSFRVKHQKSIMVSPVVFGIKRSVAERCGFIKKEINIAYILDAIEKKMFTFAMTSASQSNSGTSAYLGFINALSGSNGVLTTEMLNDTILQNKLKNLLAGISRSSGSSGWLKELFLKGDFDAMVNYESIIIETNRELLQQGKEPLFAVYPIDGIVMSDSPFGYINNGDSKKEELFLKLQEYLLSENIQKEIAQSGRRVGFAGSEITYSNDVFNPDWGISTDKILTPIRFPSSDVLYKAITLYQTKLRKPSITAYCLDYSGSMEGTGNTQLKSAMKLLLTHSEATRYLIQQGDDDISIVVPFDNKPMAEWIVEGCSDTVLKPLLDSIMNLSTGGGTDIYTATSVAMKAVARYDLTKYNPAIVLLTDGESNQGADISTIVATREELAKAIPVFSIMFGEASERQLKDIASLTLGTVFDGRKDLVGAFRKVKGYN